MKKARNIICSTIIAIILYSCNSDQPFKPRADKYCEATWEIEREDTINRTDCDGKKQGMWLILPRHRVRDTITKIDTSYYEDGNLIK